ncbi:biotin/lipoyl-binding protein, partial [Acinetobacter pittii]|uniref:biotin/lipoyl-binding protein n=1 Tax=Acinetobacter pittii TaxID=48296 RepID=UPI0028137047
MLSDTQTVTEILVKEGDEVKPGDVLMTFDTTLTELELERKRLGVEKQKLDFKTAKAELERIRALKPMDPNAEPPVMPEPELGRP